MPNRTNLSRTGDMIAITPRFRQWLIVLASVFLGASAATAATAGISATVEPAEITLGEAANLTISASGTNASQISPPMVPGLQFSLINQSRRFESVNGVTESTASITYQVVAQQPGVYTIPAAALGAQPLILTVDPAGASPRSQSGASSAQPAPAQESADGAAFVRLRFSKHELYVGESVPMEIQVGTRDGMVASLDGLPMLNGDQFTLAPLAAQPDQRSEEIIGGKPYTIFTWRSSLAAVKPGDMSLTVDTPLTVRLRTRRASTDVFDDPAFGNLFNDPAFQNFFGGTTEKNVTVTSAPQAFTVMALPTQGRPAGFSGAVGQFTISSSLTDPHVTAGDPATLRMQVSGEGNFDRVDSRMLSNVEHWKTYQPTSHYAAAAKATDRGVKTFEQPIIATDAGPHTLPPITFSYFNPTTRRYEELKTASEQVTVAPAAAGAAAVNANISVPAAVPAAGAAQLSSNDWRPNHALTGSVSDSLTPVYFRPAFLVAPAALILALPGLWLWLRRREEVVTDRDGHRSDSLESTRLLGALERAADAGNARDFFSAARALLQKVLARRWHVAARGVTLAEVDARLGKSSEIHGLFEAADEAIYSHRSFHKTDLQRWGQTVMRQITEEHTA
jgi:hypothetical protein